MTDNRTTELLQELSDLACDIHAAEIIDHVHITNRGWTFDSRWLDSWHAEFDRITDKLEQAVAATLGNERDEIYNAGFDSGVKATLQQLEGIMNDKWSSSLTKAESIEEWIDEQWKEYES